MTNLKPARGRVIHGEAIPPQVCIQCDCVICRESQAPEFVVTYARVLIDLMAFRRTLRGERALPRSTSPTQSQG